ncbi:diguanylate cyclase [Stenotrophomonas oahuensis]|uniref:diguanylate cyclase n=1 Tax=Stenotrophomonas oahuensis TaxID=3003271 RepID=A0ABY9YTD4_9GAMM|nr:diguanylate cyclase [Stenotrophomonas sp. A5586]WNH53973.1 diguanylate cyclase [Stenotrophomonas sp. A5586]
MFIKPFIRRVSPALVCLLALSAAPVHAQRAGEGTPLAAQVEQCQATLSSAPQTSLQLAQTLLAQPNLPTSVEISAVGCLGFALRQQGQLDQTTDLPARLLAAAQRADASTDDRMRAQSLAAHLLLWQGKQAEALTLVSEFLDEAVQQRDVQGQIASLMMISMIRGEAMGDAAGALTYLRKATELTDHLRRPPTPGDLVVYYNYGYALLLLQRYDEAAAAFKRAEAVGVRLSGQDLMMQRMASHRAEIARVRGELDAAEFGLRGALAWQAAQDPQGQVVTLQRLALVKLDQEDARAAKPLAEQALALAKRGHFDEEVRQGLELLGDIHLLLGERAKAVALSREARQLDQRRAQDKALAQLAQLQATAERSINPTQVNAVQDLERLRVIRNATVVALALVLGIALVMVGRLRRQRQQLTTLISTDSLTGLPNRREAERLLESEMPTFASTRRTAMLLVEIDDFKSLNDQHGQAAGDTVLRAAASCLRAACDRHDVVARWGGAGFLVARHDTQAQAAQALASHLCLQIERMVVELAPGQHITVTASIGLAPLPLFADTSAVLEDSLRASDRALQSARRSGQNAWASLWGERAGQDVDLYALLHDPADAMARGWLSLSGSRPMSWTPARY